MSERDRFIEDYGHYMEMVYIISNGNLLLDNQIYAMPATEFLFKAEYLLRKRKVENIPNQPKSF